MFLCVCFVLFCLTMGKTTRIYPQPSQNPIHNQLQKKTHTFCFITFVQRAKTKKHGSITKQFRRKIWYLWCCEGKQVESHVNATSRELRCQNNTKRITFSKQHDKNHAKATSSESRLSKQMYGINFSEQHEKNHVVKTTYTESRCQNNIKEYRCQNVYYCD